VFSLVTLELDEPQKEDTRWCRRLGRLLKTRLRSTDDVGWMSESRLGISLAHTPASGAWTLVEDLRGRLERYSTRHSPLRFSVFSHTGHGGGQDESNGDSPAGRKDESARSSELTPARMNERALALDAFLLHPPGRLKRALDLVLATLGMVLALPVLLLAALAIKLTSRGPILFVQERAGYGGRPFRLYKLRTMVEGAERRKDELADLNEADGPVFKIERDPRVTLVGRILRKTSIDELPQLWNVLRGDMSLVGPRPPTLDEIPSYASWQARRLHTIGGLTCYWQVSGRSDVGFLDWMRLDRRYLRERGFGTDLLLLLRTIPAVLVGRGAK
jgi:lipopolysaccharide/colanic/teichoic acid biosynthesis glycosyltransferase